MAMSAQNECLLIDRECPRMGILILQSCGAEHFLNAARAARERYPHADLIGLVEEEERLRIQASGLFASLQVLRRDQPTECWWPSAQAIVDLCIIPFESRMGVDILAFRRFPIIYRIGRVASYSRQKRLREHGLTMWRVSTWIISKGIRPIHRPALWLWNRLWRWMDVAILFSLALLALGTSRIRGIISWIHPARGTEVGGLEPLRVTVFIPSMGLGGAQRQVISFLSKIDRARFDVELALLNISDKFFEPEVRALGIPIVCLNEDDDFWRTGVVLRLARHLRRRRSVVLHSWLHYAVNLGTIAGALAGVPVLVGSFRSERPSRFPWFYPAWQRAMDVLNAPLQTWVIANSDAVRREAQCWTFLPERKLLTIYNGIETKEQMGSDRVQLDRLRKELNLPPGVPVVGIVGRLDPEKDHATFLLAAERVLCRLHDVRFLIVGTGRLQTWIEEEVRRRGLAGRVLVLGARDDAFSLIQLMDVLALTSKSEGFPNVLLEAGLLGTPIVTTAAGGATEIVTNGKTGFVVPCGDAEAVADKILGFLADPRLAEQCVDAARNQVQEQFSADRMASAITDCYLRGLALSQGYTPRAPVKVCLISNFIYGFFQPSSRLPFGGAEVQLNALARQLVQDRRFEVSILTGDKAHRRREQHEGMTVFLSPLIGRFQDLDESLCDDPAAAALEPKKMAKSCSMPFRDRLRSWLDTLPEPASGIIRWPIRTWFRLPGLLPPTVISPVRWIHHRLQEFREWLAWFRTLCSIKADVYVMRCAAPQVGYVQAVCGLLRKRFVYMVAHDDEVSGAYAAAQGIWGKRFERGLRRAEAVVCQHDDQLRLLRANYHREGHLIRSLCPVPIEGMGERPRRILLWVARMDEWKQPDLFLDLAERMPEVPFVMVGPPSHQNPSDLMRLRERMNRLPNLRWRKRVPFEETITLFQEALLFVNTSRVEGFPNTFLQAAACGTPVVSLLVNPEGLLDRYGFGCCAKGDWAEFESQVRRLYADDSLRRRLGESGRRFVRECHDPSLVATQYADLFLRLCAG